MPENQFLQFTIGDLITIGSVIVAAVRVIAEITTVKIKIDILWKEYEKNNG